MQDSGVLIIALGAAWKATCAEFPSYTKTHSSFSEAKAGGEREGAFHARVFVLLLL